MKLEQTATSAGALATSNQVMNDQFSFSFFSGNYPR
jgi:hypothetical protein